MNLRAIIIDDELNGINSLKIIIHNHVPELVVVAESTDATIGIKLISDYKPEIVFLDIKMPEMDGFQLLENLQWRKFHLIFTTAHSEYALKAIKANAIDYLLKPIDHFELKEAVQKIKIRIRYSENNFIDYNYTKLIQTINENKKSKINIILKNGIECVAVSEIIYFESFSNYIHIHLIGERVLTTAKPLRDFETLLGDQHSNFMRVHNSFLINVAYITKYLKDQDTIVLCKLYNIPLAKGRKESFLNWLYNLNKLL